MAKEAKEIVILSVCSYGGHNLKSNKAVSLALKFEYGELPNYIKLIQFLNENVTIDAKVGDMSLKLGQFMVHEIKIDKDGEGLVRFNSQIDYIEADNVNSLVGDALIRVRMKAAVELGDDGGEEDDE